MTRILGYKGQEPNLEKAQLIAEQVLKLMQTQLDIIREMAMNYVFIPDGTQVTELENK